MTECQICCNVYTKRDRKEIKCPNPECEFECCVQCIKTFILDQRFDPQCMSCKKVYSRNFLENLMSKNWLNKEYKPVRTDVLFEREKSLIPDTMKYVEAEKQARNLEIEEENMNKMISKLYGQIREIERERGLNRQIINDIRGGKTKTTKYKYNIRCPECPGFVNKDFVCDTCNIKVCKYCQDIIPVDIKLLKSEQEKEETMDDTIERLGLNEEMINEETNIKYHKCDEEKVASVEMLKRDTKPCPKCGTPIHKIEGCDQMWDPQCGTAFSWRTGEIVTGVVHNPHYFEYMRENGNLPRQPGDIPCGGAITMQTINNILEWVPKNRLFDNYVRTREYKRIGQRLMEENGVMENIQKRYDLIRLARLLTHIEQIEIPRYTTVWNETTNRSNRVKYIMKEMTKDDFTQYLYIREKNHERSVELVQVFQVFLDVCQDICRRLEERKNQNSRNDFESLDKFMKIKPGSTTLNQTWWIESIDHEDVSQLNGYYCMKSGDYRYQQITNIDILKPIVFDQYWKELELIEKYCNQQFKSIATTYKLAAPSISIRDDMVFQKGSKVR